MLGETLWEGRGLVLGEVRYVLSGASGELVLAGEVGCVLGGCFWRGEG